MQDTQLSIFVYGTLRSNAEGDAHAHYLYSADFISPAKIRGQLFTIDYYPGLCLVEDDQWVTGEVYLLKDNAHLHRLDLYEGCAHNSPLPHEYKREWVEVILPNSERLNVWAYLYTGDTSQLTRITTGDFLNPEAY